MVNFINDVRSALGAPDLPFVIATTGMSGWGETHPRALSLMDAQLAMEDYNKYPAFYGNVAVVDTRDFYRDAAVSPADQAYHWNRNAETYFLIGRSMALELQTLISGSGIAPLSWILSYGGDPTHPNEDGDALTLYQEYLTETDPTAWNQLEIIALGFTPSNTPYLRYRANGLPNGTLTVSNCVDLTSGHWDALSGSLSMPAGNVVQWTGNHPIGTNGAVQLHITE
jgi:hypothetical protein